MRKKAQLADFFLLVVPSSVYVKMIKSLINKAVLSEDSTASYIYSEIANSKSASTYYDKYREVTGTALKNRHLTTCVIQFLD
ncbi:hypothetical protein GCM10011351_25790 [Paraliobacillus quinghaiensis]|uniref:Uncharacterized protein n=1 Tax=Paraliobacillus quinghaiensis TaxID=470815 RepID=A0A917TUF9_9BACI|nr:hypothetical protein GCM10011351_25790 [Paraliobacillus quinghaiensis]